MQGKAIYRVALQAGYEPRSKERAAAAAKVRAFEGDDIFERRFQSRVEASRQAHWIQSQTGVRLESTESYPVTFKVLA